MYDVSSAVSEDGSSRGSEEIEGAMNSDMNMSGGSHHHDDTLAIEWDTPPGQRQRHHMAAMAAASTPAGRNPAYEHFPDDDDDHVGNGPLSVSSTNENVMFGRRSKTEPSPVQTTTEL